MSATVPQPSDVVKLDLSVGSVRTALIGAVPYVIFRPAVESIGLDYSTQLKKLKDRSWVSRGDIPTTGSDGKTYRIDANNQRKRTERNHWSEGWTAIVAVRLPGDDRSREHVILHQRRLPMWLGSIVTTP